VQISDGEWIDVLPVAGSLVINAGDLIARWTNDRWKSNVHRVINPPRSLTGSAQRLSIVLFTGPDPTAAIACLPGCAGRYARILSADHCGRSRARKSTLDARLRRSLASHRASAFDALGFGRYEHPQ
jgi:isopenicillin N synthase-like dioxygenase